MESTTPLKRKYSGITPACLKNDAGFVCPGALLHCRNQECSPASPATATLTCSFLDVDPPFIASLECEMCRASWKVCIRCARGTQKTTITSLLDHVRLYHRGYFDEHIRQRTSFSVIDTTVSETVFRNERIRPQSYMHPCSPQGIDPVEADSNFEPVGPGLDLDTDEEVERRKEADESVTGTLLSALAAPSDLTACGLEASRQFFYRDRDGLGLQYLAALAQFGSRSIPLDALDPAEVKMLLQTAELAALLPVADRGSGKVA
jgi:hypothetical protein